MSTSRSACRSGRRDSCRGSSGISASRSCIAHCGVVGGTCETHRRLDDLPRRVAAGDVVGRIFTVVSRCVTKARSKPPGTRMSRVHCAVDRMPCTFATPTLSTNSCSAGAPLNASNFGFTPGDFRGLGKRDCVVHIRTRRSRHRHWRPPRVRERRHQPSDRSNTVRRARCAVRWRRRVARTPAATSRGKSSSR